MDASAGWYRDPESEDPNQLRFWDGDQWTEHRKRGASSAQPSPEVTEGVSEGWYPDPESGEPGHLRYWDGGAWTEHRTEERTLSIPPEEDQSEQVGRLGRLQREWRLKREQKRKASELREAEIEEAYGHLTYSGFFALREIRFYDKGYMFISSGQWGTPDAFEKLISIEANTTVSKKTAPGRAAMAAVTLGANLLTSGTVRGDLYLTIQTDQNTHVLHEQALAAFQVESALTLEAAGRALLERTREGSHTEAFSPAGSTQSHDMTISDRLRELETAHSEGLMSDDEYSEIRRRLMSEY